MADEVVVVGVREVFREVRKFEKGLVSQTQRKIRKAGDPLIKRAGQIVRSNLRYPSAPTSHWKSGGRLGWDTNSVVRGFKVATGGRYIPQQHTWPLISFRQTNPAGAMFDWAGREGKYIDARGRQGRGVAFVNNMQANIRFGSLKGSKYSRTVFPAVAAERSNVVREVERIVKDFSDDVTRRLERI